jgi:hypothetical protein
LVFLLERFALDLELHDLRVSLLEHWRHVLKRDLEEGSCFVDEVDGLVWQEAVGDVARERFTAAWMASSVMWTPW